MKKTLVAYLLLAVMLCGLISTAVAMPTEHDVSYKYVKTANGGSLNLRQYASMDSDVLTTIPYGTQVMLYDYQKGDKWVLCIYGNFEGYLMTRYLTKSKPGSYHPQPTATPSVGTESAEYKKMQPAYYYATVRPATASGFVHMRWAPSTKEPIQRDYYNGQVLKVLYQDNGWCQVYDEDNDVTGYMMRKFLTYVCPVADGNPLDAALLMNAPVGEAN